MIMWWNELETLTQIFFCFALFFGMLFLWQFVMAIMGMGGHGDVTGGHDIGHIGHIGHVGGTDTIAPGHSDHIQHENIQDTAGAFQILSFRSVLAFFTLFTWYAALTLMRQGSHYWVMAVLVGLLWGLAGMFAVALVFFLLRKLSETGTSRIETCVGTTGTVYADIPAAGMGQVRCMVSGCVTCVKARAQDGSAIKAGTPVQVVAKIDDTSVEVKPSVGTV